MTDAPEALESGYRFLFSSLMTFSMYLQAALVLQVRRYCAKSMVSKKVRLPFLGAWVGSSCTPACCPHSFSLLPCGNSGTSSLLSSPGASLLGWGGAAKMPGAGVAGGRVLVEMQMRWKPLVHPGLPHGCPHLSLLLSFLLSSLASQKGMGQSSHPPRSSPDWRGSSTSYRACSPG